jgi:Ni/Co efflux regulator RcnB
MNKLLLALIASTFALGSASGFAADATKKKEELTLEQKTEIRDRVERLKAERAKGDQAKTTPAAPAKKADPKRTSRAKTMNSKSAAKV